MKERVKAFVKKLWFELRYQAWKAKIFTAKNDPQIKKIIECEMYHRSLMNAACAHLDRLTPEDVKNDSYGPYRQAVINHDWATRPGLVDPDNRYTKRKED